MASASDVLKQIKDESIEWVDLRFTDPKGKWQHLTMVAGILTEDELDDGLMLGDCRDNLAFVVLESLNLTWASSFRAMCGLNWIWPMFLIPFHLNSA